MFKLSAYMTNTEAVRPTICPWAGLHKPGHLPMILPLLQAGAARKSLKYRLGSRAVQISPSMWIG